MKEYTNAARPCQTKECFYPINRKGCHHTISLKVSIGPENSRGGHTQKREVIPIRPHDKMVCRIPADHDNNMANAHFILFLLPLANQHE